MSIMRIVWRASVIVVLLYPSCSWSQNNLDEIARQHLEKLFSASIVLTDAEAITLGFVDFDPQAWLPIDLQSDPPEPLLKRAHLRTLSFPIVSNHSIAQLGRSEVFLDARLSYFEINEAVEHSELEPEARDLLVEQVYDAYIGGRWHTHLNPAWSLSSGAGLHLSHYRNRYRYGDNDFAQQRAAYDRVVLNTEATALMVEPFLRLQFNDQYGQFPVLFRSSVHYAYGSTINADHLDEDARPEGWRFSNSIVAGRTLPALLGYANHLKLFAKRVDLGAEARASLNTPYYYELGAGWLWYAQQEEIWIDNIGIGVSVNFNSDLSGGTLVLLLNEDF